MATDGIRTHGRLCFRFNFMCGVSAALAGYRQSDAVPSAIVRSAICIPNRNCRIMQWLATVVIDDGAHPSGVDEPNF